MLRIGLVLGFLLAASGAGLAEEAAPVAGEESADAVAGRPEAGAHSGETTKSDDDPQTICQLIEAAATEHDLPIGFFTRLIWKESRFRADALSPKGAQGIAQFMPGTAALRALADPFDPIEAIPASARYLRDLADQFGNLGLAAAAYNSGEKRVGNWLTGDGGLPFETRDYVVSITGLAVDDWTNDEAATAATTGLVVSSEGCVELAARLATPGAGTALVSPIEKADWAPWGVQVAGNFSLNRAMASYSRLQRRHDAILGDQPPMVVSAVNRSRGSAPFYHIRVPGSSRDEAGDLCRRLQAAGSACVVLKTGR